MLDLLGTDIGFVIAQIFGAIGLILIVISLQMRRKKTLLKLQMVSCLMFVMQYVCLKAPNGCVMNGIAMVRNFIYGRYKKVPNWLVALVLLAIIVSAVVFYENPVGLLPGVATIVYTIGFASKNMRIVRGSDLLACLFYVAYNISVGAWMGLAATLLEMIFTIIAIVRYDIKESGLTQKVRYPASDKTVKSVSHKKVSSGKVTKQPKPTQKSN